MRRRLLRTLEALAARRGHALDWDLVGASLAHGACRRCGAQIRIALERWQVHAAGPALDEPCPAPSATGATVES